VVCDTSTSGRARGFEQSYQAPDDASYTEVLADSAIGRLRSRSPVGATLRAGRGGVEAGTWTCSREALCLRLDHAQALVELAGFAWADVDGRTPAACTPCGVKLREWWMRARSVES
jgi:hypothetical protein